MGRTPSDNSFLIRLFSFIVLLIPWLLGLAGGFIHLLLAMAIIVILVGGIQRRKPIP